MERILGAVALAGALIAAPVAAQETVDPALPPEVELALGESATRMTVPVQINAGRPLPFIVDTGAERTVVAREVAGALGLARGPDVRVTAMTGTERVGTVLVPEFTVSRLAAKSVTAPAFGARDLGAAGLVGIDALQDHAVVIDFDRQRMALKPARKRRGLQASGDDVVVTARSVYGQLIVTDAHWRGRKIKVVVDTGTPVSVGNGALLRLMTNARPLEPVSLTSVTGDTLAARAVVVNGIKVGGIGFANVTMAIADAAPFARFGLGDEPAMLMGMDLLRLFRGVQIDFPNREIRFTLPRRPMRSFAGV